MRVKLWVVGDEGEAVGGGVNCGWWGMRVKLWVVG